MECAERARELAHLEKELRSEGFHLWLAQFARLDAKPQWMTPERASLLDHREQITNEIVAIGCHEETSGDRCAACARLSAEPTVQWRGANVKAPGAGTPDGC
jgi:hypothetical protein